MRTVHHNKQKNEVNQAYITRNICNKNHQPSPRKIGDRDYATISSNTDEEPQQPAVVARPD